MCPELQPAHGDSFMHAGELLCTINCPLYWSHGACALPTGITVPRI